MNKGPENKEVDIKEDEINKVEHIEKLSLYAKLMHMRVDLQKCGIKKTGENKYSGFLYYELADFLPQCNQIACNYNTLLLYQLEKEEAKLTLINCDNPEEKLIFYLPLAEVSIQGASGIQKIGGLATYTRRYLYMIVFEISESDSFDPNTQEDNSKKPGNNSEPNAAQQQEIDDIKEKPIPPIKVNMIKKKLVELCVPEEAICKRYEIKSIEETTEALFLRIMSGLKATEKQRSAQ